LRVYPIDVKKKDLAVRTESFRSKLANGDLDFGKQAQELYALLLKPAAGQLAGKTNLVIVPDDCLWDLPFQALQTGAGKYLVETAAVSYAPSLTALREMKKKTRARPAEGELLAFGNPAVGKETSESVKRVFMGEKLEPLPEAERLVNSLKQMYGGRAEVFTGAQASEKKAKAEAPKFRIVQFATHGILNDASPMYSHIVLARKEGDPNEDGLLEAWEMKDLDLQADLVILSACDTARGKVSSGEGMIGMTWAMFIAGAPATVASQWKVESSSTTELMLEFHRQMLASRKISKAEALRRASLKLLKSTKYKHPSYWAGFVLVGDGS
jgi:CHAT domain-containing protein